MDVSEEDKKRVLDVTFLSAGKASTTPGVGTFREE